MSEADRLRGHNIESGYGAGLRNRLDGFANWHIQTGDDDCGSVMSSDLAIWSYRIELYLTPNKNVSIPVHSAPRLRNISQFGDSHQSN